MVERELGGTKMEISEFAEESNKSSAMPDSLEDKLASKKWDVKAAAFEQISGIFRNAKSNTEECFYEHGGQLKKYL